MSLRFFTVAEIRLSGSVEYNFSCTGRTEARREGDALVSQWGTPDTEQGETTYRLLPDGKMDVVDRVKGKDGTWRTFGQSGLMKR